MKFEKITPSVFYNSIQDSFKLFIDCLEFKITHKELESDNPYCVVERDNIGILIFQNKEYAAIIKPELRMVTADIESVYHKVISTCPELLHPNLNKVTIRPWGAKEFAIFDNQVCFIIQEW
jgi:hypothetical protein